MIYVFLFLLAIMKSMAALADTNAAIAPVSEKETLEAFFRDLFEESQGGYVLYGSKPICIEGVQPHETNLFMLGDELHKRDILLKEGYKIWQKLPGKSQNYFIHFYEKPSYGWQHILLINREEFIKVVKENLSLFQYILGPELSPEGLFTKLLDREESFSSVFNDNKVLIGIVLGFGTQNALHASRGEEIGVVLAKKERIPFKPSSQRLKRKNIIPSFGHPSLEKELNHLDEILFISKDLVKTSSPLIPWFGCLKNKETEQLLKTYVKTQKKVREILNDERFLEKVLTRCGKKEVSKTLFDLSSQYRDLELNEHSKLSSVVAKSIYQGSPEHDNEWMEFFTRGMRVVENDGSLLSSHEWYHLLDNYRDVENALRGKLNLMQCEELFSKLTDRKELTCLVPGKLYYKVIRKGKGEIITTSFAVVEMEYVIKNHLGKILCTSEAEDESSIDLSNCIAGFAEAIKGMSIGEEREIYIHPTLAYGESSQFHPNAGLIAEVKLVRIFEQEKMEGEQPILTLSLDAESSDKLLLQQKHQDLRNQLALQLGARTWAHFKKGKSAGYSLEQVIESLLKANEHESPALNQEEEQLLTKLHWRIYHLSELQ